MTSSFVWLRQYAPEFRLSGSQVKVLDSPEQFFETIKSKIEGAKRRVVLASLYLGTGSKEQALVTALENNLMESSHNHLSKGDHDDSLQVQILLDYTRGLRGESHNSATMLRPLARNENVNVHFFHSPILRGLWRMLLPARWNEVVGLQHMKVYLFDDDLLLSGANLSDQYFVNRQDRYILVENCSELCDFYSKMVSVVASCSFRMDALGALKLDKHCKIHPFSGRFSHYSRLMRERIETLLAEYRKIGESHKADLSSSVTGDTRIYPLMQLACIGVTNDDYATQKVFSNTDDHMKLDISSGYFNMTSLYRDLLLATNRNILSIIMASPKANGFFNGAGLSGSVPAYYVHVAKQFFFAVRKRNQQARVELLEYERENWTFHSKGIWFTLRGEQIPSCTFIGSPNYGYRSVYRDLESQFAIVTDNETLKLQLQKEKSAIVQHCNVIDDQLMMRSDHHVPFWVGLVARFIRTFF